MRFCFQDLFKIDLKRIVKPITKRINKKIEEREGEEGVLTIEKEQ